MYIAHFLLMQIVQGNTNPIDVVYRAFPKPVLTRYIKLRPVTWETGISLRFEVYGCKITGKDINGDLSRTLQV